MLVVFVLCMESNALEKSTNSSVTLRFLVHTPSMFCVLLGFIRLLSDFFKFHSDFS